MAKRTREQTCAAGDRAVLDVGGTRFASSVSTLTANSTYFAALFSRWDHDAQDQPEFFLDRDPDTFRVLLSCMRHKRALLPEDRGLFERILLDAQFLQPADQPCTHAGIRHRGLEHRSYRIEGHGDLLAPEHLLQHRWRRSATADADGQSGVRSAHGGLAPRSRECLHAHAILLLSRATRLLPTLLGASALILGALGEPRQHKEEEVGLAIDPWR